MILIFSQDKLENSTEDVMDWLSYYDESFIRINGNDFIKSDFEITIGNEENNICLPSSINSDNITSVWYRRWGSDSSLPHNSVDILDHNTYMSLKNSISKEYESIRTSLERSILSNIEWLSTPSKSNLNKLYVLSKAKEHGLLIPDTMITTSKSKLIKFLDKHEYIISKFLADAHSFIVDNNLYMFYTTVIDRSFVESKVPEKFPPSLFQNRILKDFEIRAFFIEEKIYSMAIFSQTNSKTEIDFRNYDNKKPNRSIPYILPKEIESKLLYLMKDLGLNTGSIDIIKDKNGNYIFLEVNPVGQFGMVSYPCNYNIEKEIANFLKRKRN